MARVALALVISVSLAGCASKANGGEPPAGEKPAGDAPAAGEITADTGGGSTGGARDQYDRPGYFTYPTEEGRLWVFAWGAKELDDYLKTGDLAKRVVLPREGPGGMTLAAPDRETALGYLGVKPGFTTRVAGGRMWVFRDGAEEIADFDSGNISEKRTTMPGQGPLGCTLLSPDRDTAYAYIVGKQGFATLVVDGRLWVFEPGSQELADARKGMPPEKHITMPGAAAMGMTLKSPDRGTAEAYIAAQPGFVTAIEDGRVWVFRPGSDELAEYERLGTPPEKHITRPGAGPLGMTVKAPDADTAAAYITSAAR